MYWLYIAIILFIALVIIGIIVLPWITERLLFIPDRNVPTALLDNEFITANGISTLFYDRGPNTPIIIYSHGNAGIEPQDAALIWAKLKFVAGNIFGRQNAARLFSDMPVSLLLYDYAGFGRSLGNNTTATSIIESTPRQAGLDARQDGEHIYNHVTTTYPNRDIILWANETKFHPSKNP